MFQAFIDPISYDLKWGHDNHYWGNRAPHHSHNCLDLNIYWPIMARVTSQTKETPGFTIVSLNTGGSRDIMKIRNILKGGG